MFTRNDTRSTRRLAKAVARMVEGDAGKRWKLNKAVEQ